MRGDHAKKEMSGNAKLAVSFVETVAVLWGHVHFICFVKEVQAGVLLVLKQYSSKEE